MLIHLHKQATTTSRVAARVARSATTARMPRIGGYNVQTAVEADNHLIIAHEVTMLGFDRDALSMMTVAARDAMTTDQLTAIAPLVYAAHTLPGSG